MTRAQKNKLGATRGFNLRAPAKARSARARPEAEEGIRVIEMYNSNDRVVWKQAEQASIDLRTYEELLIPVGNSTS